LGCHGIITATCNVTATLSRKVYDDFVQNKEQSVNEKLCNVRNIFEEYNLISAIHTFMSQEDRYYNHILPPLRILDDKESKKLLEDLKKISLSFIRNCKGVCDILQKDYQLLNNFVDARNTLHINWLKWMGFSFINKHQRYGVERRLFYEFVKI